jgi:DNA-binding transcriptional ArsR family regulator
MTEHVSNETTPARRVVAVTDHLGVDLLLKLSAARCLAPFMRTEHTLGSAAAELEMPPSSLSYYVTRFQRAGLVTVVRREPRAGKPIPVYRATADEFRVAFETMPPGMRDQFLNGSRHHVLSEFTAAMDREVVRRFDGGIRVSSHPVRGMQIELVEGDTPDDLGITEWWGKIRLTEQEAHEYAAALRALAERFGNDTPGPDRRTYITMLGLVPEGRRR